MAGITQIADSVTKVAVNDTLGHIMNDPISPDMHIQFGIILPVIIKQFRAEFC